MNSFKQNIFLFLCVFITQIHYSQNIDSLREVIRTAKHDIVKCNALNVLIEVEADDSVWPKYNQELMEICETNIAKLDKSHPDRIIFQKYYANALNNSGYLAIQQNNG